jgi:hypothetical protein
MTQCESLVNSRVLSALNQAVTSGFLTQDLDKPQKQYTLEVYVTSVSIKLSVQNGESITNVMESGAVYLNSKESRLEDKEK